MGKDAREIAEVAILAHANRDTIVRPGEPGRNGYGGAVYSATAAAALFGPEARVTLHTDLAPAERADVDALFAARGQAGSIRLGFGGSNGANHAELTYGDDGERRERVTLVSEPFSSVAVREAAPADFVAVNLVSGREMSADTFTLLKQNRKGVLLLDVHCLARPVSADGVRRFAPVPDAKRWVAACDVVQGSAPEISALLGDELPRPAAAGYLSPEWRDAIGRVMQMGAKVCVVTFGAFGAWAGYAFSAGRPRFIWQSAVPVTTRDATGCGDCFSMGFLYGLHAGRSRAKKGLRAALARSEFVREAMRWGALAGAAKASVAGFVPSTRAEIEAVARL